MASKKQFHKLSLPWAGPIGRNAVVGGKVIGDYLTDEGKGENYRVLVIEMPKVEKKAGKKPAKRGTGKAQQLIDAVREDQAAEVTHGA